MNSINFDKDTIKNLQSMINKGDLNDVISQIPPDMVKNFSSIMSNNNSNNTTQSQNSVDNSPNNGGNNSFDLSQIDMNTVLKIKSIIEKMNKSNDSRSNLLYSLKPYLRKGKKEKLDQYANFLNIANIVNLLNDNNKEKPKDG